MVDSGLTWICKSLQRALMLAAAAFAAAPASAQTTAYAPGQGSPNSIAVPIQVAARVGTRCTFKTGAAPTGSYDQPDFDVSGLNHDFPFTLDCTGPSRMAVVSTNGGLKNSGTTATGYTNLAPYDVTLNIAGNGGTTVSGTCAAATLTAGSTCPWVGPASQTQGLKLAVASQNQATSYVRVSAPAYAGGNALVSGNYSDTLVITVSISP